MIERDGRRDELMLELKQGFGGEGSQWLIDWIGKQVNGDGRCGRLRRGKGQDLEFLCQA
jgi:hypothetical protein